MSDTEKNEKQERQTDQRNDSEQLNQIALGNTDIEITPERDNNDLLSLPKTSGTGSNPAAANPESLIVHEDKKEKRYEEDAKDNATSGE
ncbi:hypothetical protein [Pedobacter alluvionis]|uniref:Uncharacterized protein n=1 Tax=Pedobacter alluvionis TaxID=475253 RepID=A0A497XTE2_9SPHI|nr:hypothetical protein [Pedobacter alluvionis]RLJ72601.1 hypothetical protein BCL90_4229 [Pedobacter alluvionis]TFB28086.1 hypothetical protein E3V97_23950 [Pedobacter alluvionis]